MRILRSLLAFVVGVVSGGVIVGIIESISHRMHPLPEGLGSMNPASRDALAAHIAGLQLSAFLMLLFAWSLGCCVAAAVGRLIAPERRALPGFAAGMLLLVFTVLNLVAIPHPLWLGITGPIACFVFTLLGLALSAPAVLFIRGSCQIRAAPERVFRTLSQPDEFTRAVPAIEKIEFVGAQRQGVGTRFRETRQMNGRQAVAELAVTELVENERVRIDARAAGTLWSTLFRVSRAGGECEVQLETQARPSGLGANLWAPLLLGMVRKGMLADLEAIKRHCEAKP